MHILGNILVLMTIAVAFVLLRRALRKDPRNDRDGLETTTFAQQGRKARKWRYRLAVLLSTLYLPAAVGTFETLLSAHSGSGPDSALTSNWFVYVVTYFVLVVVIPGFPYTLKHMIKRAVPPPVEYDRDGKPVQEDDHMFAMAVAKSQNPYTFLFSDLRRHATNLPLFMMMYKIAVSIINLALELRLGVAPHVVFVILSIGATAFFHKMKPYQDRFANKVATLNHSLVGTNAFVAALANGGALGGGVTATLLLILQIISVVLNYSNTLWRSDTLHRKFRDVFGVARFSHSEGGQYMVLDPATDFVTEVHKRLWQPALDRLLYYGDGLALPLAASVTEQAIRHDEGLYDAVGERASHGKRGTPESAENGPQGGQATGEAEDRAESGRLPSSTGMGTANDEYAEELEDAEKEQLNPSKGMWGAGASLMNKAASSMFRRHRRKDDPLSDCGIVELTGCPPALLNFRGTVGERHFENRTIMERIGASAYETELQRLKAGASRQAKQCEQSIWNEYSAVDMYWRPDGGQREGTGFGKAIICPFPMRILFQYDTGSSVVLQPATFADYVAKNEDREILRRRDVRHQLRALAGKKCYFFHKEWQTKTKSYEVSETVYENGQYVTRTRTIYYTVSVLLTFKNGKPSVGTLPSNAEWNGADVAPGFKVTMYFNDGYGVDREGPPQPPSCPRAMALLTPITPPWPRYRFRPAGDSWSNQCTTLGHGTLGINDEYSITADLDRLLRKNDSTVFEHRPQVQAFWARYRQHYGAIAEHKKNTLSYDFSFRVSADRSLMKHDARAKFEELLRLEPNEAVWTIPERFGLFLGDLYTAVSRVLCEGRRSAAWFTFWQDFWTMNCDISRIRKQAAILNPMYRTSIPLMYLTYAKNPTQLKQELVAAKLRSKNGARGFFRDGVLEVLWEAMEMAQQQ